MPAELFAQERARRTDDAVHDGNVAGEKIGKLRQKQGGAQIAHQPFVEKRPALGHLAHAGKNAAVGRNVALAAGGRHDHVGVVEELRFAGEPRVRKRKTGGVDPHPLPQLHLALVALFRDLLVEIQRAERMHDVGCEALVVVGRWIAALQMTPRRLEPLAKARDETDAGDPHLTAVAHVPGSLEASSKKSFTGTWIRSPHSTIAWRSSAFGNGTTR